MYSLYEDYYTENLSKDDLALYLGFKKYLKTEIKRIAHEVNKVLSSGLSKINEEERKAYHESEEYKKAVEAKKEAEAARDAENASYAEYNRAIQAEYDKQMAGMRGMYSGLESELKRLGYWTPAGREYVGHTKADSSIYDSPPKFKYSKIKIPNIKEYTPVKSVQIKKERIKKYRNKYSDTSTCIGLLFLFLDYGFRKFSF